MKHKEAITSRYIAFYRNHNSLSSKMIFLYLFLSDVLFNFRPLIKIFSRANKVYCDFSFRQNSSWSEMATRFHFYNYSLIKLNQSLWGLIPSKKNRVNITLRLHMAPVVVCVIHDAHHDVTFAPSARVVAYATSPPHSDQTLSRHYSKNSSSKKITNLPVLRVTRCTECVC